MKLYLLSVCLLVVGSTTALAAIATVDVGASAVSGEWRPSSCDDVKDGVVLTNIPANTKAIIEGCTITVAAGNDITKSAVSISGLGAQSSIELRDCTVTATFHNALNDWDVTRYGAILIQNGASLGDRSAVTISSTTLIVEQTDIGNCAALVSVGRNVVAGDHVALRIFNQSTMRMSCVYNCAVIYAMGDSSTHLRFGHNTSISIENSTVDLSASGHTGSVVHVARSTFGDHAKIFVDRNTMTVTAGRGANVFKTWGTISTGAFGTVELVRSTAVLTTSAVQAIGMSIAGLTFGHHGSIAVTDSSLQVTGGSNFINGVYIASEVNFGTDSQISIARANVSVASLSAVGKYVYAIYASHAVTFASRCTVAIVDSTVSATGVELAMALRMIPALPAGSITISNSTVSARGGKSVTSIELTGALISGTVTLSGSQVIASASGIHGVALRLSSSALGSQSTLNITDCSLIAHASSDGVAVLFDSNMASSSIILSSSSFEFSATARDTWPSGAIVSSDTAVWADVTMVVTATRLVAASTTTSTAAATFVLWPKTITAVSTQALSDVTLSAPTAAAVQPFGIATGGTGPGPQATLCLRRVRWAGGVGGGAEVTAGPAAFSTPPRCIWTVTPSLPQSSTASAIKTSTKTVSPTQPPSLSLTAPVTATAASWTSSPSRTHSIPITLSSEKSATPTAAITASISTHQTPTPQVTQTARPTITHAVTPTHREGWAAPTATLSPTPTTTKVIPSVSQTLSFIVGSSESLGSSGKHPSSSSSSSSSSSAASMAASSSSVADARSLNTPAPPPAMTSHASSLPVLSSAPAPSSSSADGVSGNNPADATTSSQRSHPSTGSLPSSGRLFSSSSSSSSSLVTSGRSTSLRSSSDSTSGQGARAFDEGSALHGRNDGGAALTPAEVAWVASGVSLFVIVAVVAAGGVCLWLWFRRRGQADTATGTGAASKDASQFDDAPKGSQEMTSARFCKSVDPDDL